MRILLIILISFSINLFAEDKVVKNPNLLGIKPYTPQELAESYKTYISLLSDLEKVIGEDHPDAVKTEKLVDELTNHATPYISKTITASPVAKKLLLYVFQNSGNFKKVTDPHYLGDDWFKDAKVKTAIDLDLSKSENEPYMKAASLVVSPAAILIHIKKDKRMDAREELKLLQETAKEILK